MGKTHTLNLNMHKPIEYRGLLPLKSIRLTISRVEMPASQPPFSPAIKVMPSGILTCVL